MGLLRFVLAVAVILAHAGPIFGFSSVGGPVAVQAFYIISGFYMTLILNEKYIGINNSYGLFITNRLLKLYPIYWIILFATILCSIAFSYTQVNSFLLVFNHYATYFGSMNLGSFSFLLFTNVFLFFQDAVMFLGLDTSDGNLFFTSNFMETSPMLHTFLFVPQAWTIGVEITFYLIAPFLVRRNPKIIVVLILLSLLLRFCLYSYGLQEDPWSYRFFPTELVFFMLGTIAYHIYLKARVLNIKDLYLKIIFGAILAVTLLYDFLPNPFTYYVYFFLFFTCLPFIFILTKKWKVDAFIGELSYPIYISHMFVLLCMQTLRIPKTGGLTVTIVTVLLSILLNQFVTKRIEKIRQRRLIAAEL